MGISNCIAIKRGMAALLISKSKTIIPQCDPHVLATLVAPVLPLPTFLMSIPLTHLLINDPKDIEPIK
jgi:hypothetical protein